MILFLAGCQFEPTRVAASDAPDPADAAADAGPPDALDCGQAPILADDFEDGTLCNGWPTPAVTHANVQELGGHLVILADTGHSFTLGGCITEGTPVALGGHSLFVEVPQPSQRESTYAQLKAYLLDQVGYPPIAIKQQNDEIQALKNNLVLDFTSYDESEMRWWRLRSDGSATYYETSPDGRTWSAFATDTSQPQPNTVRVELLAGTWTTEPSPLEVRFDNLNVCSP